MSVPKIIIQILVGFEILFSLAAFANINPDQPTAAELSASDDYAGGGLSQAQIDATNSFIDIQATKCTDAAMGSGTLKMNENLNICMQTPRGASICQTIYQSLAATMNSEVPSCCRSSPHDVCKRRADQLASQLVVEGQIDNQGISGGPVGLPVLNPTAGTGSTSAPIPMAHRPTTGVGSTSPKINSAAVPEGTTPQAATQKPEDTAARDAQSDIAACQALSSQAQRCCGNPISCDSSIDTPEAGSGSGMASCQKQKQLGAATKRAYTKMYSVCSSPQSQCELKCGGLMQTYQNLINSCGEGCANSSVYADAMTKLSAGNRQCVLLRTTAQEFLSSSQSGAVAQGGSKGCENETGDGEGDGEATPSSLADLFDQNKDAVDKAEKEKTASCQTDPNLAECQKPVDQPVQTAAAAPAAFAEPKKSVTEKDFNVADVNVPDSYVPSTGAPAGEAPTVNTVPNNSGGGIPGGAAVPGGAAGAPKVAGPAAASYSTEVFTGGFQAGGYSASAMNGLEPNTRENLFPRRKPAGEDFNSYGAVKAGTDLKSFLPGGANDPNRLRLGMNSAGGHAKEITSPFTDNWDKVSVKFKEKCILELTGCDLTP